MDRWIPHTEVWTVCAFCGPSAGPGGGRTSLRMPEKEEMIGRERRVFKYTFQVLTGHGSFGTYLKRIGKIDCVACWYCEEAVDENVEHAIFECNRWASVREECETEVGRRVNVDNMIELMLKNEEGWIAIERMLVTIMKTCLKNQHTIEIRHRRK